MALEVDSGPLETGWLIVVMAVVVGLYVVQVALM